MSISPVGQVPSQPTETSDILKKIDDYFDDDLHLIQRVACFALAFFLTVISCGVALFFENVRDLYSRAITGKVHLKVEFKFPPKPLENPEPLSAPQPGKDLEKENLKWKALVESCPPTQEISEEDPDYLYHYYRSRYSLLDGLFFGEFQAYQSLDERFIKSGNRYAWFTNGTPNYEGLNKEQAEEILKRDPHGCSEDNIQYIVSIGVWATGSGREFRPQFKHLSPHPYLSEHMTAVPEEAGILMQRISLNDRCSWEEIQSHFPEIFDFLDRARQRRADDQSILIYDRAKTSYCITVLTAYLYHCFKGEVSIDAILNYIKSKRPIGGLEEDYIAGLKMLEKRGAS